MKNRFLIIITFFLLISIPISNVYSQQFHKILDVPRGSGTTNNSTSSENSNTTLYLVGGVIIAGVIIYALLKDKKKESIEDTTAVLLNDDFLDMNLTVNEKIVNMQSQVPISILFGAQIDRVIREEKRYFVGLNYNF